LIYSVLEISLLRLAAFFSFEEKGELLTKGEREKSPIASSLY